MNKKGFTLIELLAVIVILAIVLVIGVMITKELTENAEQSAAERGADHYFDAVETAVGTSRINGKVLEGRYTVQEDGSICPEIGCGEDDVDNIKIDMSGNKPSSGTIVIENGIITNDSVVVIGQYHVNYDSQNGANIEILCNAVKKVTTGNVSEGKYVHGDEYICDLGNTEDSVNLTFFVLEEIEENVTLILNKNLGGNVAWVSKTDYVEAGGSASSFGSYGNNRLGPLTANKALAERTKNWTRLKSSQIAMPTVYQVKAAKKEPWLYDNGGAYWTSTIYGYGDDAWVVTAKGDISSNSGFHVNSANLFGVRPIITIPKYKIGEL